MTLASQSGLKLSGSTLSVNPGSGLNFSSIGALQVSTGSVLETNSSNQLQLTPQVTQECPAYEDLWQVTASGAECGNGAVSFEDTSGYLSASSNVTKVQLASNPTYTQVAAVIADGQPNGIGATGTTPYLVNGDVEIYNSDTTSPHPVVCYVPDDAGVTSGSSNDGNAAPALGTQDTTQAITEPATAGYYDMNLQAIVYAHTGDDLVLACTSNAMSADQDKAAGSLSAIPLDYTGAS